MNGTDLSVSFKTSGGQKLTIEKKALNEWPYP